MGPLLRAGHVLLGAAFVGVAIPSCYSAGAGSGPPPDILYFPEGLAVDDEPDSAHRVLYVVNADFDLQYSGGTLQSYNLSRLRRDASLLIQENLAGGAPPPLNFVDGVPEGGIPDCTTKPPIGALTFGQSCAPPVTLDAYKIFSVTIGAFATDLQFGALPALSHRLFAPVRGVAAVTWADVGIRFPGDIACGQDATGRCDSLHDTGNDPNSLDNTRNVTMPGEPFGMAQSGAAIVVTHQTDTKTSLLWGATACPGLGCVGPPSMKFVLDGLPLGGDGIAEVPHDPDAPVPPCPTFTPTTPTDDAGAPVPPLPSPAVCVRPAFLETNHSTAEIDLVRYYDDDGTTLPGGSLLASSLKRPFLTREAFFPINSNAVGSDSRGIVIDSSPRENCKALGYPAGWCAQKAARVFFASRTPPALGIGEVGGPPLNDTATYNADRLVLTGNAPLPPGPSKIYLAPIVNLQGNFELRVFIVLFDSSQIAVYDPEQQVVERYIDVGRGPFAMAFDPFDPRDVAAGRSAGTPDADDNRSYRYAYVASFTESFVQMIDLDNTSPAAQTFERVVFTLGKPTLPKGQSQ